METSDVNFFFVYIYLLVYLLLPSFFFINIPNLQYSQPFFDCKYE